MAEGLSYRKKWRAAVFLLGRGDPCQVKSRPGSPVRFCPRSRARDWKHSRLELSEVREAESGAASEGRRRGQSGLASAKGAEPTAKFTKRREDGEGAWKAGSGS